MHIVPIQIRGSGKPPKGYKLFNTRNAAIFILAKRQSGKTTVVINVLPKLMGKKTKLLIASPTVLKDATYEAFIQNTPNEVFLPDSIEDAIEIIQGTDEQEQEVPQQEPIQQNRIRVPANESIKHHIQQHKTVVKNKIKKKQKRKSKYYEPDYMLVIDDWGSQMRTKALTNFIKRARHYKTVIIMCGQNVNDLMPETLLQLDYVLAFSKLNDKKLQHLYKAIDLAMEFDAFQAIYKDVTSTPFSFLYIDAKSDKLRNKFNKWIN